MAETPDQTRREIEATRLRIAEAAEELEERIKKTAQWRTLIGKYPLESMAIAFALGAMVGSGIVFRAAGRAVRTLRPAEKPESRGGAITSFIRPVIVSLVTARLIDYMRRETSAANNPSS